MTIITVRELLDVIFTKRNEEVGKAADVPQRFRSQGELDTWEDQCYFAEYWEIAAAHAAVAILAPLFESIFVHEFPALKRVFYPRPTSGHPRCLLKKDEDFWNPHKVAGPQGLAQKREDLIRGSLELIDALNIHQRFPDGIDAKLRALFSYRNKALHNGYEWPVTEQEKFRGLSAANIWNGWFTWRPNRGDSRMIWPKDEFLSNCVELAQGTLKGFWTLQGWGDLC